jgi:hypothetical protein
MFSRDKRGWKAGFEAIPDDDSHRPIVAPARDGSHAPIVTASAIWALIGQKVHHDHNKSPICSTKSPEKYLFIMFLLPFVLMASFFSKDQCQAMIQSLPRYRSPFSYATVHG